MTAQIKTFPTTYKQRVKNGIRHLRKTSTGFLWIPFVPVTALFGAWSYIGKPHYPADQRLSDSVTYTLNLGLSVYGVSFMLLVRALLL